MPMKKINKTYNPDVLNCIANLSNDEVFTPPALANKMLDTLPQSLFSNPDVKFLDPFCKSGVFLREIVKRLDRGLASQMPDLEKRINHILKKQVYGIAITELTSLLSRRTVYCSKVANGSQSVVKFTDTDGNIYYKPMQHTWEGGKCKFCGASQSVYDRTDEAETYAYNFIHVENINQIFNMKFDVIIGNPPYQLNDGGNGASAKPIYHLFVEQALKLNPKYLCMITPSRWFAGGKGLDEYRNKMLSDRRIRYLKDYVNAKDCFPETSIGGGVSYFLWQKDYSGDCMVSSVVNGVETSNTRPLNEFPVFVRLNNALNIIHKVDFTKSISSLILSRNPFGIPSAMRGGKANFDNSYCLYSSAGVSYILESDILINKDYADLYKVSISKVICEHAGEPDKNGQVKLLSSLRVLPPKSACTDSYLIIGKFRTEEEANNLMSYLSTKFVRFLIFQAVSSINLSKDKFQFVPLQDFSHPWTDEMLYEKYNLDDKEIDFIESMIRPME